MMFITSTHIIHHHYNWSGTDTEEICNKIAFLQNWEREMNIQTLQNWQHYQNCQNGYNYQPEPVVITEYNEYDGSQTYYNCQYATPNNYQHNEVNNDNNEMDSGNTNGNEMDNSNKNNEVNECNVCGECNELCHCNNSNEPSNNCNEPCENINNPTDHSNQPIDNSNEPIDNNELNEVNNDLGNNEPNNGNNNVPNNNIQYDNFNNFNETVDSLTFENMPVRGFYLTKTKSKWIEIFHIPYNPKNEKFLRLGGYTCKRQVYTEIFFTIVSWQRLYSERHEILKLLEENNERTPYKYFLNRKFSVELCYFTESGDKMLCFIQNQDKFYMKRKTFINLISHDEWVRNNLKRN